MAILQSKPKADAMEIPASLRRNGQATPSVDELLAKIAALEAQVAAKGSVKLKISEKGALSVYGLQRFPITLYKEQWQRLLAERETIEAFIAAHTSELSTKG